MKRQVFGIGTTKLTSEISRRTLYCSKQANGKYSIVKFVDEEGNLKFFESQHFWADGIKCKYCGVSKKNYSLVDAFNPSAVKNVMCTNTISVSWEGYLFDCDFNQMLDLKVNTTSKHISSFDPEKLIDRDIQLSQHCYGCTAGAGSSCQGSIA